jgi:hypothetical protein
MHLSQPSFPRGFIWKHGFIVLLLLFTASTIPLIVNGQQVAKSTRSGIHMWLYTPATYQGQARLPLLVFLHGDAEVGNDLSILTTKTHNQIPPKLIASGQWDRTLPFIVVSPQLKRNDAAVNEHQWPVTYIDEVIEYVKEHYRIDDKMIYLTGISAGGTACWNYAIAKPAKVTAISPIAGTADKSKAILMKNIPVWAFHGENDLLISPRVSAEMINAINSFKDKLKPRLTLCPSKGHEVWNELYDNQSGYNIYQWFLRFRKATPGNIRPYVNAGMDLKISFKPGDLTLSGDFFDWDGSIASVRWTQVSGSTLVLDGANGAFPHVKNLKAGSYEFQLTVSDNSGAIGSDRVKVEVADPSRTTTISSLILMNGKTNSDIKALKDGMVIDKTSFEAGEFNVKAIAGAGVHSVRFRVNSDHATRTANALPFVLKKQSATAEWIPSNGTCVICATPYSQPDARGTAGATLCYRIIFTQSAANGIIAPELPVTVRVIDDVIVSNMGSGNQWVHNGVDIPGATGPILKPLLPGDYYVRQLKRSNFDVSNIVQFQPQTQRIQAAKVEVYPNLAKGYIQVKAGSLPERSSYRILRAGVTIQQGELYTDRRIELKQKLPKGDYVLIVNGPKDADGTKFFIR